MKFRVSLEFPCKWEIQSRLPFHRHTPLESRRGQSVPRGCAAVKLGSVESPKTLERQADSSVARADTVSRVLGDLAWEVLLESQ